MSAAQTLPHEFKSSDLSRSSGEVFAAASEHPVTVTRRDGENLVMMTDSEDRARRDLLDLAAQLIVIATDSQGSLAERMSEVFPWMFALSPQSRDECARAILQAARASFSTKQPHLAIAELTSWKETATALAAGLRNDPVEWLDDNEPVEQPTHG